MKCDERIAGFVKCTVCEYTSFRMDIQSVNGCTKCGGELEIMLREKSTTKRMSER